MSHFTVMVIGDEPEKQLAPYHEYECTGVDDEYVIDIDCTEEVEEWKKETVWVGFSKETGEADYHLNEEQAVKNLNDITTMSRVEWIESKHEEDEDAETLDEYINDWFGYKQDDEGRYWQHTNPNSKWDWYQVGGRWSGFFKMKDSARGELGEKSWCNKNENIAANYADVTTKGNIDLEGMMEDIRKEKEITFNHLVAAMGDTTPVAWATIREEFEDIEDARKAYRNSDFKQAIAAYEKEHDVRLDSFMGDMYEDYYLHLPLKQARLRYVETAAMNVITPYAFVKDSEWVQRGEMGWWGMSSNEMEKDDWTQAFYKMFQELPDDTLITMVDCHI